MTTTQATAEPCAASGQSAGIPSAAQHTPGPWRPVKDGATGSWMLLRDIPNTGGRCELATDDAGDLRHFANEAEARAAIGQGA